MASLIETPNSFRRRSEFYHQLSVLLQAGVGLTQSLEQIAPPSQRDGLHIRESIDRLNAGETFSETLIGRENWLPAFDRMMIEAGEAGGRLDDTLRILSDHYHQRSALIRDVLMKLAYPLFIIHFIILMPGIRCIFCALPWPSQSRVCDPPRDRAHLALHADVWSCCKGA